MKYNIWTLALLFIAAHCVKADACVDFLISAQDNTKVVGRSLEFAQDLHSEIKTYRKGKEFQSAAPNKEKALSWKAQYDFMAVSILGTDILIDGMNEKGLSFAFLWMPGTEYSQQAATTSMQAILIQDVSTWLLGTVATVQEAKEALKSVFIWGQPIQSLAGGIVPPVHIALHDRLGNSSVVEFMKGQMQIYDNPIHVLTNAPTFDWHLTNLTNYLNLKAANATAVDIRGFMLKPPGQGSGMLGVPGDWSPPSRFVRVSVFKEYAKPTQDAASATNLAIHLLNTVDIPFGNVREDQENDNIDYTQWVVVKDLTNGRLYYRTYADQNVREFTLK